MDLSVVICSYNPSSIIFGRCLNAVDLAQKSSSLETEVIIVDNNSTPALEQMACVGEFLAGGANRWLLREQKPGKTQAILKGLEVAKGKAIIINDDDNLPSPDYFSKAEYLLREYPHVGVWGPGSVVVEWQQGSPKWVEKFDSLFLAKHRRHTEFGRVVGWPHFYPAGAGTVVRRVVLDRYAEEVRAGKITAMCRSGEILTSGGDSQIVYTATQLGLCSGLSPELSLVHFINRGRTRLKYMSRLVFSVMSDGRRVFAESFPEEAEFLMQQLPSRARFIARVGLILAKNMMLLRFRYGVIEMASYVGEQHGIYKSVGAAIPPELRLLAKLFR